jgi:hypothetical protein
VNGAWSQTISSVCNTTANTTNQACIVLTTGTGTFGAKAVCGDAACANQAKGVCTTDGKFRACVNGLLQPAAPCQNGGSCVKTYYSEECMLECVAGESHCSTLITGETGVASCVNGSWAKTLDTVCSTLVDSSKICVDQYKPGAPRTALCSTPACANVDYVCTADGKVAQCVNGTPSSTLLTCPAGTVCSAGQCIGSGSGGCKAGESQCIAGTTSEYRTCVNGQWSATPSFCPANIAPDVGLQKCTTKTNADSTTTAVCAATSGVCTPGASRCIDPIAPATISTSLQVCTAGGTWGAGQSCVLGKCTEVNGQAKCQTNCVPGQSTCMGPGYLTCPASGIQELATPSLCAPGTTCRASATQFFGCVECLGVATSPGGFADTRCTPGGDAVQTCSASNTWSTPVSCNGGICFEATVNSPAQCTTQDSICEACATTCPVYAPCQADKFCSPALACLLASPDPTSYSAYASCNVMPSPYLYEMYSCLQSTCDSYCSPAPACGDHQCTFPEDSMTCPADCGSVCGNKVCEPPKEDPLTCPMDCSMGAVCGNKVCEPPTEDPATCPMDCTMGPVCGNNVCEPPAEDPATCPMDCVMGPVCGNAICESPMEDSVTCPKDCP